MNLQQVLANLGTYYKIGDKFSLEGFTIYPVIGEKFQEQVITIYEAEKKNIGWIQELKQESVQELGAVNKGHVPMFIPYLHQTQGGRQDRTIFEPILVPTGYTEANPMIVPARCVEHSRWTYSSSRGVQTGARHESSKARMSSQMAYWNTSSKNQSVVWDSVEETAKITQLSHNEAPTSSYREMHQRLYEKDKKLQKTSEQMKKALSLDKQQVGMIIIFEKKLLGIEIYGSTGLWHEFSETALNGYLLDQYFLKDLVSEEEVKDDVPIAQQLQKELQGLAINSAVTTGLGQLYNFNNAKWTGLSLWHHEGPIHIFAVKEHRKMSSQQSFKPPQNQVQQQIPIERISNVEESEEEDKKEEREIII